MKTPKWLGIGLLVALGVWLFGKKAEAKPPPPGQGSLEISVIPVNINPDVYVDGVYVGRAPFTMDVDVGTHIVEFWTVTGYLTPEAVSVDVTEGQVIMVVGTYILEIPETEWQVRFTGVPPAAMGDWTYMSPAFNIEPSWAGGTYLLGGDSWGIFIHPWDNKVGYGSPQWGDIGYLVAVMVYDYLVGDVPYQGYIIVTSQQFSPVGGMVYTWNISTGAVS